MYLRIYVYTCMYSQPHRIYAGNVEHCNVVFRQAVGRSALTSAPPQTLCVGFVLMFCAHLSSSLFSRFFFFLSPAFSFCLSIYRRRTCSEGNCWFSCIYFFSPVLAGSLANDSSQVNVSERSTKMRTYLSVNEILLLISRNEIIPLGWRGSSSPRGASREPSRWVHGQSVRPRRVEPSERLWPRASRCCTRAGRSVIASPSWAARHGTEEGAPQLQHRRRRERLWGRGSSLPPPPPLCGRSALAQAPPGLGVFIPPRPRSRVIYSAGVCPCKMPSVCACTRCPRQLGLRLAFCLSADTADPRRVPRLSSAL